MINLISARNDKKSDIIYKQHYFKAYDTISQLVDYYYLCEKKTAIWGGGLKGTAFLRVFDLECHKISAVFDISKEKQGKTIVNGHVIKECSQETINGISAVYLMNSNHETEVAGIIRNIGSNVKLFNIDSIIYGDMTFQEVTELYEGL